MSGDAERELLKDALLTIRALKADLKVRDAELKARDARIERLESELAERQPATKPATKPVDDIDRTRAEVLKDIESREPGAVIERVKASFNPDIAVIVDTLGSWSDDRYGVGA